MYRFRFSMLVASLVMLCSCVVIEESARPPGDTYSEDEHFVVVQVLWEKKAAEDALKSLRGKSLFRRYAGIKRTIEGGYAIVLGPYNETRAGRYLDRSRGISGGGDSRIVKGTEIIKG